MRQTTHRALYDPKAAYPQRLVSLWRHMRRLENEGNLSAFQQLRDLIRLRWTNGVGPALYLMAGLYRRDMTWQRKRTFAGDAKYRKLMMRVNRFKHDYVARNKIITYGLLKTFGISTPPFYGVIDEEGGVTCDGRPLRSPGDLADLFDRLGVDEACFKFVSGTRGKGFYRVTLNGNGTGKSVKLEPDGEQLPLKEFWDYLRTNSYDGYFCQGVVDQHPDVARFNPWSLNTVRTWMVREDAGWQMAIALLRMGRGKMSVDNTSAGGIAAKVDVATGRLSGVVCGTIQRASFTRHPESGIQIEGEVVPMWSDIVALCKRTARHFPYYRLLAVDVASTPEGPIVMELGTTPDSHQVETDVGALPLLRELAERPWT